MKQGGEIMGYQANEDAAYAAEQKKEWRKAYGLWNECLSYMHRYDPNNKQKIEFIEMKIEDCRKRMK